MDFSRIEWTEVNLSATISLLAFRVPIEREVHTWKPVNGFPAAGVELGVEGADVDEGVLGTEVEAGG